MKYRLVIDMVAALLIFLFVYTALSKLGNYSFFLAQLRLYPLISPFAGILSWAIPFIEVSIAMLLLLPACKTTGLIAALMLLIVFTVYLIIMLLYTPDLPCSCGGVIQSLTWSQHIVFNSCFIMVTLVAVMMHKRSIYKHKNVQYFSTLFI